MADQMIKKVRQVCVSVMALCLILFAVYHIQSKTATKQVNAGTDKESVEKAEEPEQFLQRGETQLPPGGHSNNKTESSVWSLIFGTDLPELVKQQGKYCVMISKKGGTLTEVFEEMIYRRLTVTISGATLSEEEVYRICGEQFYTGVPDVPIVIIPEEEKNVPLVFEPKTEEEDTLRSLTMTGQNGKQEIVLEFNTVYEVTVTEDEEFVYLSLIRPQERYDKIVVVDAGHGGIDPGTSGGGATEAAVNLAVVQYAKEILDARDDLKVYYTRLNNTLPDLSTRVEFANALHADMLISVHCNHNPVKSINGVEVLYSKLQADGELTSYDLAGLCLEEVSRATGLKKNTLVERSSNLHLMKYCTMPSALIEFGYMSNRGDLDIILSEEAQRACAEAICRVIDAAYAGTDE